MKIIMLSIFMFLSLFSWAHAEDRYLDPGKVLYEKPLEENVMKVKTSMGYCTVLEFPDKPMLVTVGDNSLIQVEIPQNSKSVVIKPLQQSGETNLFVFTPNQRFNYKVIIASADQMDYVLDAKQSLKDKNQPQPRLSLGTALKIAKSYDFFKRNQLINDREFVQKNLFYQCAYPYAKIDIIEVFSNKDPHYLLLHIVAHNQTNVTISLNEQKTSLFVGENKFIPQYVLFDNNKLAPLDKTDGWLVLENSFVSVDNKFSINLGIEDDVYECKQSVS